MTRWITTIIVTVALGWLAGWATADSPSIEVVAADGAPYAVTVDGAEASSHTTLRKAVQSAANRALGDPSAAVRIDRDATWRVTATVPADPAPEPGSGEQTSGDKPSDAPAAAAVTWTPIPAPERSVYVSNDGDDSNSGLSADDPAKTVERGYKLLRDGHGDHMYLKSGDTFRTPPWIDKSGRSADAPLVITSYGDGPRPVIQPGWGGAPGIKLSAPDVVRHFWMVDLDLQNDGAGGNGIEWGSQGAKSDLLIEGCRVAGWGNNISFHGAANVRIRNSVIVDSSSQGVFAKGTEQLLVEGCVLDHNGWREGGDRNIYDHNLYLTECSDVTVKGNVIARGESQGLKISFNNRPAQRYTVTDNLFVDNVIGVTLSHSGSPSIFPGHVGHRIHDNVFDRQSLLISFDRARDIVFEDNLSTGARSSSRLAIYWYDTRNDGVTVRRNTVYDFPPHQDWPLIGIKDTGADPGTSGNLTDITVTGNELNLDAAAYVDASRDVAGYHASLGETGTVDAFLRTARQVRRDHWPAGYTAEVANAWIRAGFERVQ